MEGTGCRQSGQRFQVPARPEARRTEIGDGDVHEVGKPSNDGTEAEVDRSCRARTQVLHQHLGPAEQGVELGTIRWRCHIELDHVLTQVAPQVSVGEVIGDPFPGAHDPDHRCAQVDQDPPGQSAAQVAQVDDGHVGEWGVQFRYGHGG